MKIQGRMLVAVLVLIFVAGLFGGAVAAPKGKPAGKVPKLVIESKTVQLGEVPGFPVYVHPQECRRSGASDPQCEAWLRMLRGRLR
jgi:hypothetical protein